MTHFDAIIVGQGLAGTTLAWELLALGWRVGIVDANRPNSASRVAAGLITPITGKRLAIAADFPLLWQAARAFYARAEIAAGASFFHRLGIVRLFANARDEATFAAKQVSEFAGHIARPVPLLNAHSFDAGAGGFLMPDAGRVDVPVYLQASRSAWGSRVEFAEGTLDYRDILLDAAGVRVGSLGWTSRVLAFCEGVSAGPNPWFPRVPFAPTKGELLTIRVPGLDEERVVNRGVWLLPLGGERFLVGATYDRDHLDDVPTAGGRAWLESRLRAFLKLPYDVLGHRAGVRPILHERKPVIGLHPRHPQLAYFNGLGSKGALAAPHYTRRLADALANGTAVEPELDAGRYA